MKPSRATAMALLGTLATVVASTPGVELPRALRDPVEPRRRPSGPPNRSREESRRRRQMAKRGLPVVEPAPVDERARRSAEEGGVA